ncbi:WDR6 [Candida oxycetoniae]|uniref:WDR6 n=1 Tax=Candida oxycetoniae TaxID=497107 RepID=A0AAI9STZ7_9ASCO|nr:WDR6 [Candida oxycetoniae]KAI3403027.2 WDR6 [Candida oxycetoniae]
MVNNRLSSLNEDKLSAVSHYGPVTAIKIFQNCIFVGYGPVLKIYQLQLPGLDAFLIFDKQLFKRNKIHCISINEKGQVVVSGAKSFLTFTFNVEEEEKQVKEKQEFKEWKIDEWIVSSRILDDGFVLLLSAYNVIYKLDPNGQVIEQVDCGEKSISYSGSINVLPSGDIYIATGTVMNGVIIWKYQSRDIVYRLNDHDGSIFSVKIDSKGMYIVSCSDDRSIKLYDFATGNVLATGWGHGSRIWNLEFGKSEEGLKIMSIGEDCTLRIWAYHNNSDLLEQVQVIENCHSGKNIWSGDMDDLNLKICCTGGADGRVRVHDLDEKNQVTTKIAHNEFACASGNMTLKTSGSIIDYFELTNLGKLVCLTSAGYIVAYNYGDENYEDLGFYKALGGFGIVSGFNEINTVLITSRTGDIVSIIFGKEGIKQEWHEKILVQKLTNVLCCSSHGRYFILVEETGISYPFRLWEVTLEGNTVNVTSKFVIFKNPQPFQLTAMTVDAEKGWVIIASKKSSLIISSIDFPSSMSSFNKVGHGDAISSVSVIGSEDKYRYILITTRDGLYMIAQVYRAFHEFRFRVLHKNKLTRMFIEGGYMNKHNDLILYGFKSSYFIVWNESKQMEIMSQFCGGNGHRHFKFHLKTPRDFRFIYSFKSNIYYCQYHERFTKNEKNGLNCRLLHSGTHGREIRDLSISKQEFPDGSRLLISSAEDSTICLSRMYRDGKLCSIWSMNNHISGMQKVRFFKDKYVLSSAANEEFLIWEINYVNSIPTLNEIARLKSQEKVPDLRVMDFDAGDFYFITGMLVVTVFSNSLIKLWKFSKEPYDLKFFNEWKYSTCCILNCRLFRLSEYIYLLISTTDGFVTIWDITNPKRPKLQVSKKLHQSGVKAICLIPKPRDCGYYLVTGGDDNALTISIITVSDSNDQLQFTLIDAEETAASATITSISKVDEKRVVVVSVDQIIRLWSFENDKLVCELAKFTTVADTGCCDVIDDMLVVGGAGISIERIKL